MHEYGTKTKLEKFANAEATVPRVEKIIQDGLNAFIGRNSGVLFNTPETRDQIVHQLTAQFRFLDATYGIDMDSVELKIIANPKQYGMVSVMVLPKQLVDVNVGCSKPSYNYYADMRANLIDRLGDKLGAFVANRMSRMIRKRKAVNVSHVRVAKITDTHAMNAFYKARGCCGSAEEIYEFDGFSYLIGFNYGH